MSETGHLLSARTIKRIPHFPQSTTRSQKLQSQTCKIVGASKRNDHSLISKKSFRAPPRLIKISTAHGRWHGNWNCDYLVSLRDLQLEDLAEDEQEDPEVSIKLCIQQHASFGFSVDGRIITSFTRTCSNCFSPYCRKIDTNFNVWILPSSTSDPEVHLPEIGVDDPSVIYVKPGYEAHLDSLIQDTIRLNSELEDTCSDSCEISELTFQDVGGKKEASVDKRWSRLLELKKINL